MIESLVILMSLVFSAIFSSFETALVSSDPLKIYASIKGKKALKRIMNLFKEPSKVINALVVSVNVANICVAVFSFSLFKEFFSVVVASTLSAVFTVGMILIMAEVIPKIIAFYFPQFVIMRFYYVVRIFMLITLPLVQLLNFLSRRIFPSLWKMKGESQISRKEIEVFFHDEGEDFQSKQLVEMIYRILAIDNIRIKESKIPINQIMAFPSSITVAELRKELTYNYYSRIPIYNEDIFNIIGYVVSFEILFEANPNDILLMYKKDALFFPENKAIDEAIEVMEECFSPIGFVVDEFGAVSGMVTHKDLNELIVGSFQDERRSALAVSIVKEGEYWICAGRQDVDELNDRLGLSIVKDGFETLAGFVMYKLGTIPKVGESFSQNGFLYEVKEMRGFYCAKILIGPHIIPDLD